MLKITENDGMSLVEDEIVSVEELDFEGFVYDACCESPHLYITNDFVSHNCILWVDEIDKAVSGSQSSGQANSGVVSRVISTFLTWMQEKEAPVFVVATANNYDLPPELLRAGRFDEVFFVDLPNIEERSDIFAIHLKKKKLNVDDFSLLRLSKASEGYSGAEIEKAVEKGMIIGFSDKKRAINTEDILKAMKSINSLAQMRGEEFETVREWASKRCAKANVAVGSTQNYFSDSKKELEIS